MSLVGRKITAFTKTILALPVKPNASAGLTAADLQAWFDSSSEQLRQSVNGAMDDLIATTGAAEIGAVAPAGLTGANLQALQNAIGAILVTHTDNILALVAADVTLTNSVDTANSNASNAVSTALAAANTANDAFGDATIASSNAAIALSASGAAVTTANAASALAIQTAIDFDAIEPSLLQAVADAEAAVAAVAGKADIAYVDQVAANFVMGIISPLSITEGMLTQVVQDKLNSGTQLFVFTGQSVLGSAASVENIPVVEYTGSTDIIMLYVGGVYQAVGIDYTLDPVAKTVTKIGGSWESGYVLDFTVYKNVSGIAPTGFLDGALLGAGSVQDSALAIPVAPLAAQLEDLTQQLSNINVGTLDGCQIRSTVSISIANSVYVDIPFNTEDYDTNTMHDTSINKERVVCKEAGLYNIIGVINFDSNGTGVRSARVMLNGITEIGFNRVQASTSGSSYVLAVTTKYLEVGDYITLQAQQTSGASLSVSAFTHSPKLTVYKIGESLSGNGLDVSTLSANVEFTALINNLIADYISNNSLVI